MTAYHSAVRSSTAVDTLGSTSMKPRRPNGCNRSDGCSEGSSFVPGGPPVALPAEFNLDSRGIPSYNADEVSSADSKADSPRNPALLQDAGTASCWADLPDGLLREVRAAPALPRYTRLRGAAMGAGALSRTMQISPQGHLACNDEYIHSVRSVCTPAQR